MGTQSPPTTPPSETPRTDAGYRFVNSMLPCEWVEDYRPEGFHPVIIGDALHQGRYRIIRKLGDGSFSTVWLAVDSEDSSRKYVAIKIMMAKYSTAGVKEIEIASRVSAEEQKMGGASHVLRLLHSFEETGPNGVHLCLVYQPMAVTVASGIDALPQYRDIRERYKEVRRYPKWMVKSMLKHTLLGLRQLHSLGIVHSDLQPGNILFEAYNLDTVMEEDLIQGLEGTTETITRLDGKQDKWAPRYLAVGQSLSKYANFEQNFEVKISNLGAGKSHPNFFRPISSQADFLMAFYRDEQPDKIVTPVALRAPEVIWKQKVSEAIDVWSFGILIYELITATMLLPVAAYPDDDDDGATTDDDHMLALNDILGDLPDNLVALWPRSKDWFGPNRERLNPLEDKGVESIVYDSLEAAFEQYKPDDVDEKEAKAITRLIRWILKYDPSERPTVEQILKHEWFVNEREALDHV